MRIVTIVGARPQYIKLAPLHSELLRLRVDHRVINTGQHYDYRMAGVFFTELKLPKPTANLTVGSTPAPEMTARIMERAARALTRLRPDLVVVIGDTNSTLGGALAAKQLRLPLAHIEAGLRCHDLTVPEELNRVVTDRIADLLLCPTASSVTHLRGEGRRRNVILTGDLLYDVVQASAPTRAAQRVIQDGHGVEAGKYLLMTIHRADLTDSRVNLERLVKMIRKIDEPIILPLHPRTLSRLRSFGLVRRLKSQGNLEIIEPLGYVEMLALLKGCRRLLTDSGGLQREAYFLRVPTLLIRDVTEWTEISRAGGSVIVGLDERKLKRGLGNMRFRFNDRRICRTGAARRIAARLASFRG